MPNEHLTVRMGLDNKPFIDGLSQANSMATRFGRTVKGALAGAGIVGGIATIVSSLKSWAQEAKNVIDTSENLGVSAALYLRLGDALRKQGNDAGAADTSLQKFTDTLAAAQRGETAALKVFERLNLGDQVSSFTDAEQALQAVRAELDRLGPSADRTSIALDLFGKKGLMMLDLLGDLPGEIGALEKAMAHMQQKTIASGGNFFTNIGRELKFAGSAIAVSLKAFAQGRNPADVMNELADATNRQLEYQEQSAVAARDRAKAEADAVKHMAEQDRILEKDTKLKAENAKMQEKILRDIKEEFAVAEAAAKLKERNRETQKGALGRLRDALANNPEVSPENQARRQFLGDVSPTIDLGAAGREADRLNRAGNLATSLGQFNTGQDLRRRSQSIRDSIEAAKQGENAPDKLLEKNVDAVQKLIKILDKGVIAKPVNGK
jgi:hypothetical protein